MQSLRDRLLAERDEEIAQAGEPVEPHSMSLADSATDEFDHELALGLLSHEQDALYEVDAAIHRILDGNYGRCEESGRAIPAARLLAVPWTRRSKKAQERMEERDQTPVAHLGKLESVRQTLRPGGLPPLAEPEDDETPAEEQIEELMPFRHEKVVKAIEKATVEDLAPLEEMQADLPPDAPIEEG